MSVSSFATSPIKLCGGRHVDGWKLGRRIKQCIWSTNGSMPALSVFCFYVNSVRVCNAYLCFCGPTSNKKLFITACSMGFSSGVPSPTYELSGASTETAAGLLKMTMILQHGVLCVSSRRVIIIGHRYRLR